MTWSFEDDKSEVIITAKKHINSSHANKYSGNLPDTCVIFEIGIAMSP